MEIKKSTLYIVATPIGNLEDISLRALQVLKHVDAIICEDTRVTSRLLSRYEIPRKPLISHFKNQEAKSIDTILSRLQNGESCALVSDAGTPGVSDPGNFLVKHVINAGFTVVPIPGPSAVTALMSVSHRLIPHAYFEGFLPHKKGRKTRLEFLAECQDPVILYESTHRIIKCLEQILTYFGDRQILVGRELTKLHETVFRGSCSQALEFFKDHSVKGEFVLIVFPR